MSSAETPQGGLLSTIRYAEIRALVAGRLASQDPALARLELVNLYCLAITTVAHENGWLDPGWNEEAFAVLIADVREHWSDVVDLMRRETMHQSVEAVRRGVPLSAASDVVDHIVAREFVCLPPL